MKESIDLNTHTYFIAQRLEEIALLLEKHKNTIKEPGLLNGKLGVALFLFQYSALINNSYYEELASMLIDEIFACIETVTSVDFSRGLSGIGWGIEYLIQNGYVDGDSNEILTDFDDVLFSTQAIQINSKNSFWGHGLYFCSRLFDRRKNRFNDCFYNKEKYLDNLLSELEQFFIHRRFLDFSFPVAGLNFLVSVFYFLSKVQHLVPRSNKIEKILPYINSYSGVCGSQNSGALTQNTLLQTDKENNLFSGDGLLLPAIENLCADMELHENAIAGLTRYAQYSLFFQTDLSKINTNAKKDLLHPVCDEISWRRFVTTPDENKLSIENGIAGIGIALMNYVKVTGTYKTF